MRLGIVRGQVVLSKAIPALRGSLLLLVEPVTALLIKLTGRHKVPAVGIKFVGLDSAK